MCVCVCACVHACVRACVHGCVCVCVCSQASRSRATLSCDSSYYKSSYFPVFPNFPNFEGISHPGKSRDLPHGKSRVVNILPSLDCTTCIYVAKTKALISFTVTAKLICVFVFAYAKCLFSHYAAQIKCIFDDI